MVGIISQAETTHFCIDRGSTGERTAPFLQDENRSALRHHEPVAAFIEGTTGASRLVVASRHSAYDGECPEAQRRQRRLGSACHHHVGLTPHDCSKTLSYRDGT
jgi:hypothetical protein